MTETPTTAPRAFWSRFGSLAAREDLGNHFSKRMGIQRSRPAKTPFTGPESAELNESPWRLSSDPLSDGREFSAPNSNRASLEIGFK